MDQHIIVELVDESGQPTGTMEKAAAHAAPGALHRAFSVFLVDDRGRLLMQRRAATKYHSPGVWTNSCCGHPEPGEPPLIAARNRIFHELRVAAEELLPAGLTRYRHADPLSGLVEHEYNHTFVGRVSGRPDPDPDEVSDFAFLGPADIDRLRARGELSVWFDSVLAVARPRMAELSGPATW